MNNAIFKTGMKVHEVIAEIVRINPAINNLEFYVYSPRLSIAELQDLRDSVLLSRLLFHDCPKGHLISREKITAANLLEKISSLNGDSALSVLSKVKHKKKILHIPMMDFSDRDHSGKKVNLEKHLSDIIRFLEEAGYNKGVVLFSGKSFHYYGTSLMTEERWRSFLANCSLSGLADERYIAHRYKDGCGILRISACSLKPKVPRVVAVL